MTDDWFMNYEDTDEGMVIAIDENHMTPPLNRAQVIRLRDALNLWLSDHGSR